MLFKTEALTSKMHVFNVSRPDIQVIRKGIIIITQASISQSFAANSAVSFPSWFDWLVWVADMLFGLRRCISEDLCLDVL
jgi:hypothetical protein